LVKPLEDRARNYLQSKMKKNMFSQTTFPARTKEVNEVCPNPTETNTKAPV
jgi:hypothetical protein